jgi:hypothetical protein
VAGTTGLAAEQKQHAARITAVMGSYSFACTIERR